jgi:ribose transport system substrate-binding protein
MARLLRAHPEINTILGVNDESAIGAIAALRAAGKNPADYIITGVDAEPQASALIKKGEFTASVTVYTKGYAYLEMYVLRDLAINGDKSIFAVCREIYEESPLITKDNVDAYMEGQGWNKK